MKDLNSEIAFKMECMQKAWRDPTKDIEVETNKCYDWFEKNRAKLFKDFQGKLTEKILKMAMADKKLKSRLEEIEEKLKGFLD